MINKVILIGNVGKDPEVRHLENGKSVANFTLATTSKYKDQQGAVQESTEWHQIVFWGKVAEVIEKYIKKGSKLYIEGSLKTRSWEKDGVTRYTTEILGVNMTMLGGSVNNSEQNDSGDITEQNDSGDITGDLPF